MIRYDSETCKNRTRYKVQCSYCSTDSELWGEAIFETIKGSLDRGIFPCGCKKTVSYTENQNKLRVTRKCEILNYVFLGWEGGYKGSLKTKIKVFDNNTKTFHVFTGITSFFSGHRKTRAELNNQLSKRDSVISIEDVRTSLLSHKHSEKYRVIGRSEIKGYWDIECSKCSYDEYVNNNLCKGIFSLLKGDIDRGVTPCRCATGYRWTQEQREYQINNILDPLNGVFEGWECGGYERRSSRFIWTCSRGHQTSKDVLSFIQGGRCPECYKEDKCYGYYHDTPDRKDFLYLARFMSEDEIFYKVGRSFVVGSRLSRFNRVYNCEIVSTFEDRHDRIYMLEQCLHRLLKCYHYTPCIYFKGCKTECFTLDILNHPEIISSFNLKPLDN